MCSWDYIDEAAECLFGEDPGGRDDFSYYLHEGRYYTKDYIHECVLQFGKWDVDDVFEKEFVLPIIPSDSAVRVLVEEGLWSPRGISILVNTPWKQRPTG